MAVLMGVVLFELALVMVFQAFADTEPLSTLTTQISHHQVVEATVDNETDVVSVKLKDGKQMEVAFPNGYGVTLVNEMVPAGVKVSVDNSPSMLRSFQHTLGMLSPYMIIALVILLVVQIVTSKSKTTKQKKGKPKKTPPKQRFSDVKGADEAVASMKLLCDFLKNPQEFLDAGETPQRGCILSGGPGTGKTLLAHALAGEAGVPFYSTSGADFVGRYAGQTTEQVRKFFEGLPSKNEPCVVFIDEIDAIGESRISDGSSVAHDQNATLTQLLINLQELFEKNPSVIVLAATNRYDDLDDALKRPEGRLGKHIVMPDPDETGRLAILKANAEPLKRMSPEVDLEAVAKLMVGMSGADVASIPNSAATISRTRGSQAIEAQDFVNAIQELVLGAPRTSAKVHPEDAHVAAVHESGHTLAHLMCKGVGKPHMVTIVPAGETGGGTWSIPRERKMTERQMYLDELVAYMAGNAAELILLGEDQVTAGAAHDLARATEVALLMVCQAGMGKVSRSVPMRRWREDPEAEDIAKEVNELIEQARRRARELLEKHRPLLEALRDKLLEAKTIDAPTINALHEGYRASHTQDAV